MLNIFLRKCSPTIKNCFYKYIPASFSAKCKAFVEGVPVSDSVSSEDFSDGFNKFTIAYEEVDAIANDVYFVGTDSVPQPLKKASIWTTLIISYHAV